MSCLLPQPSIAGDVSFFVSQGEFVYDKLAIEHAIKSFVGSSDNGLQLIKSSNNFSTFLNQVEDSYQNEVQIISPNLAKGISLNFNKNFNQSLETYSSIGYQRGQSEYYLPDGLTPFTDPIDIKGRFEATKIATSILIRQKIYKFVDLRLSAGVHLTEYLVVSNVQSNLLDIKSRKRGSLVGSSLSFALTYGDKIKFKPSIIYDVYEDHFAQAYYRLDLEKTF